MNHHNDDGDQVAMILMAAIAFISFWAVMGLLVLMAWLTRLLIEHVLDPLFGGWLQRNDGAVIGLSVIIWTVVGAITASTIQDGWLALPTIGGVVGLICGMRSLTVWWTDIQNRTQPVFETIELLSDPVALQQPVAAPNLDWSDLFDDPDQRRSTALGA